MKKRLLFVDDTENVLQGLRRMLRSKRHEWDMEFAASGEEALAILSERPADVIVADMRMPGMDGAELLSTVMERHPQTIRIVLSGQSDKEMIMKSIGPTHQYLSKPCNADELKNIIERALALRDLLTDEKLKGLVAQIRYLPSLPTLYLELMQELQSANVTMKRVGEIISKDVGMTAKILQLVNSAFFGLRENISSPIHAAKLLGPEIIKALVLSVQVFSKFDQFKIKCLPLAKLLNHSLSVAAFARRIAILETQSEKIIDHAIMAGLLHDTGKLVLAENLPDEYGEAVMFARQQGIGMWQAEQEIIGATHAEIGAYLLGLWGLPDNIVEALAYHHRPQHCLGMNFSPLTAVHVANVLEHAFCDTKVLAAEPDREYLQKLGLADRLQLWQENCRQASQERETL
ncbi:MAG: HDOD domain-containing protein [bacterium]